MAGEGVSGPPPPWASMGPGAIGAPLPHGGQVFLAAGELPSFLSTSTTYFFEERPLHSVLRRAGGQRGPGGLVPHVATSPLAVRL